jgi:heat shock protein HslJ
VPAPAPAPVAAAPVPAPDPEVLGLWLIEQARSAPLIDKRSARLDFGPDGALSGNGSCNKLSARYTLEGNKLKIGPIVTTRMACPEALLEQEDRVLTALERAARAGVPPHGFLTLWDADGAVLLRASRL